MKFYRFEVYANKCVRIQGTVEAENEDEARSNIESGYFYTDREEDTDCDVNMNTLELEKGEEIEE